MIYDVLPYPTMRAKNLEEYMAENHNYLLQLRETLEFILSDIGWENLSNDVKARIMGMGGSGITEEEIGQLNGGGGLTIPDVINSDLFQNEMGKKIDKLETGAVGQVIGIAEVDASGKPTKYNAVNN